MTQKPVLSVRLKDEFNDQQCTDAAAQIRALPGVEATHFQPEGCFGLDLHRVLVVHQEDSDPAEAIRSLPEVENVRPGYNFD